MKHTLPKHAAATVKKHYSELRVQRAGRPKTVHLKAHHAKPYRKRHYSLLTVSLAAAIVLFATAITLIVTDNIAVQDARQLLGQLILPAAQPQMVSSTLGFSFTYDPNKSYIGAISATDGNLYVGSEVSTERAYQTFKLSSNALAQNTDPATITIDYLRNASKPVTTLVQIEDQYVGVKAPGVAAAPERVSSETVEAGGQEFERTLWLQPAAGAFSKQFALHFVTYVTLYGGKPLIVRTDNRLGTNPAFTDADTLVMSMQFTHATASITGSPTAGAIALASASRAILDSQVYSHFAAASSDGGSIPASQLNSALYSPAVVKIYNVYCTDITVNGKPYLTHVCNALTGSGFFVTDDGYIATNGHVATSDPKDLALTDAFEQVYVNGDTSYLLYLSQLAGLSSGQLASITDPNVLTDTICNAVYSLPDSMFSKTNGVSNLLVDLTSTDPDTQTLLTDTGKLQSYPDTATIKHATLVGANYRAYDGFTKYRDSDVALIKIPSAHYPMVALGSINDVSQGSNLSIMGYPGAAQGNDIVSGTQDSVTLTSGKVSAIKNANGDSRKLIQTDTTIGHGNSGGPALDDAGNVVGIATYSVDQSGQGGGVFNYVRDIADLKALAASLHVSIGKTGELQQDWQQAIMAYDASHYSRSLGYLDRVKTLDPEHPTVDTFISSAKQAIKDGKDIPDFPVGLLIVGALVCLAGAGFAVLLIARHHAHHQVYQVVTGQTAVNTASFGQSVATQPNPYQVRSFMPPANPYQVPVAPTQPYPPQAPVMPAQPPAYAQLSPSVAPAAPAPSPYAPQAPATVFTPQVITPSQPSVDFQTPPTWPPQQ